MTSSSDKEKLNQELFFLLGVKSNFKEFYTSWWRDKCSSYKGNQLSDYYDIFFSRFVAFNSLYNTIIQTKENLGLLKKRRSKKNKLIERGDKEKATVLMSKELTESDLDELFEKREVIESMKELVDILKSKAFVITHKACQPVPEDDSLILADLEKPDKRTKCLATLNLLYNVRCNLFHGAKAYQNEQIRLLKVINEITFHIATFLYIHFMETIDGWIKKREDSLESLEKANMG